ncbi:50S ribosomal protein L25/general stress protein Ctc [Litoreibacter janthinus]|uniref:Large ribosomal subunit protein bL25 n=1 Tax=Litoreibacter janthinus TaxID=670154 RepID=A0A1I6HU35_9RHOB|nr:50S ribosomal protein L25/general stress protein Ctc [Litoreibacter janthinus]SFR57918.1 LSU ribosomal protein L25P [Litoreibacter janthinus]
MAGKIPDLEVEARAGTGKGAARTARRNGMVPGVVYGGGEEPQAIQLSFNKLLKQLRAGRFMSTLQNMKIEGQEDVRVICRNVQRDLVKDLPTHIDFMRLRRTSKINLFIHVDVVGEDVSPGLKKGGTLTLVRPEVELMVTAGDIPESITIDVSETEVGENVTISSVKLPAGAKPTIDRDFVIATLSAPSSLKSAGDDESEDEGEDAPEAEAATEE